MGVGMGRKRTVRLQKWIQAHRVSADFHSCPEPHLQPAEEKKQTKHRTRASIHTVCDFCCAPRRREIRSAEQLTSLRHAKTYLKSHSRAEYETVNSLSFSSVPLFSREIHFFSRLPQLLPLQSFLSVLCIWALHHLVLIFLYESMSPLSIA